MAYKIVITTFAYDDEYDAYVWYEEKRNGLGDELLKELAIIIKKFKTILNIMALLMKRKN